MFLIFRHCLRPSQKTGRVKTAKKSRQGESTNPRRGYLNQGPPARAHCQTSNAPSTDVTGDSRQAEAGRTRSREVISFREQVPKLDNDPSAGSPTETLLRLLLPLNAQVWSTSRQQGRIIRSANSPWTSLKRSIGSSDGRCVQRAGT